MSCSEPVLWGHVDGVEVFFPVEVTNANVATMTFSVPAAAAAKLLPGTDFVVAEGVPGTATLVLALCDYVENPWGDYNEINLGILARPAAHEQANGSFVYRMPVNQEFTCKAGNAVMGFPKTVEEIDATYTEDTVTFVLRSGGVEALRVSLPRAAALGEPEAISADTYSYLGGEPYVTPLTMDMGTGFVDGTEVAVTLGQGPVAEELRSLGLPAQPEFCTWGEGLTASFQLGRPLA